MGDVNDSKEADISRYFNNAPRTIFDDIVAPNEQPYTTKHPLPDLETFVSSPSNPFFSVDDLLDDGKTASRRNSRSSSDPHRDAWIPSDNTRKVLRTIATSSGGTIFLDRDNLTMPGLALQGDMPDLIKKNLLQFLSDDVESHRSVLIASDVTPDERGLRTLIQSACYRAAINLSGRLLAIYAQGYGKINQPSKHTPQSLQLWYTRLALLVKCKEFELLEKEAEPFGNLDKPDMYFRYYPELYGTRPGSMAPFAFRLLLAEIPQYCGKPKKALDKLHEVLAVINKIISNLEAGLTEEGIEIKMNPMEQEDAIRLWSARKSRTLISIVNCAVGIKNYVLGIDILERLCKSHNWTQEQLNIFKSSIGRLHLFLGDVLTAQKLLVSEEVQESEATITELVDRGLLAVAKNSFQEAYNYFQTASTMDPSNVMLVNNMAVCLLYIGQLKAAVHFYENAVAKNPSRSLQEPVLLNMCTSYELHTNHCKRTKLQLLRQLSNHKGDAIDIQCLKLGT